MVPRWQGQALTIRMTSYWRSSVKRLRWHPRIEQLMSGCETSTRTLGVATGRCGATVKAGVEFALVELGTIYNGRGGLWPGPGITRSSRRARGVRRPPPTTGRTGRFGRETDELFWRRTGPDARTLTRRTKKKAMTTSQRRLLRIPPGGRLLGSRTRLAARFATISCGRRHNGVVLLGASLSTLDRLGGDWLRR